MGDNREDEWFYDSIHRYKQIAMFDIGFGVNHMVKTDSEHICVVGRKPDADNDDIVELQLPSKLLVDESQEGLEKHKDLKIVRGGVAASNLFQTNAVLDEQMLITSEHDSYGLSIYDLGFDPDCTVKKIHEFCCNLLAPRFSFNGANNILLTTTNKQPVAVMDIISGQFVESSCLTTHTDEEFLMEPQFLTDNMYAMCVKNLGSLYVSDVRSDKLSMVLNESFENDNQVWTTTSLYQQYVGSPSHCATKIACVSSGGKFLVYDLRYPTQAYCSAIVAIDGATMSVWDLSLQATKSFARFSVSGCGGKVNVYDIDGPSLKLVFAHDGHIALQQSGDSYVKCHMFLKDDMLLSADNYMSLHCWQFVPSM